MFEGAGEMTQKALAENWSSILSTHDAFQLPVPSVPRHPTACSGLQRYCSHKHSGPLLLHVYVVRKKNKIFKIDVYVRLCVYVCRPLCVSGLRSRNMGCETNYENLSYL